MDNLRVERLKASYNPEIKCGGAADCAEAAAAVELQRTVANNAGNCLHRVCLPVHLHQLAP